jgi:hypothetical protein
MTGDFMRSASAALVCPSSGSAKPPAKWVLFLGASGGAFRFGSSFGLAFTTATGRDSSAVAMWSWRARSVDWSRPTRSSGRDGEAGKTGASPGFWCSGRPVKASIMARGDVGLASKEEAVLAMVDKASEWSEGAVEVDSIVWCGITRPQSDFWIGIQVYGDGRWKQEGVGVDGWR